MPRSRNIKPGLAKNEVLAELGPYAQLLFAVLPCYADRDGRLEDRPKRIKAEVFPYYEVDCDALLEELATCSEKFIVRYEVDGKRYIQITNFDVHQSPHCKESESTIPAPCKNSTSPEKEVRSKVIVISNKVKGISNKKEAEQKFLEFLKPLQGFRVPHSSELTDKRRKSFHARLEDDVGDLRWFDAMLEALERFPLQCFQQGDFTPDVEFLLRPDTVTRILEGKYDWTPKGSGKSTEVIPI